ncbi:MAG TPA: hypothetical protein DDY98_06490 [Ruminococcaceae bacterium]|nr:hypothetical protein [Oscillospiraceae bacterium]
MAACGNKQKNEDENQTTAAANEAFAQEETTQISVEQTDANGAAVTEADGTPVTVNQYVKVRKNKDGVTEIVTQKDGKPVPADAKTTTAQSNAPGTTKAGQAATQSNDKAQATTSSANQSGQNTTSATSSDSTTALSPNYPTSPEFSTNQDGAIVTPMIPID